MMFPHRNDPLRLKYLRGTLLYVSHLAATGAALNPDDPFAMGKPVLVQTLETLRILPSEDDLRSSLRYLEAKHYVEVEWLHDGSGDWMALRLLPAGIDLVERSTSDPGVAFQRRQ